MDMNNNMTQHLLSDKINRKKNIVRAVLLFLGVACVIAGVVQGDYNNTLAKAIKICMECVGIG